jgi:5-methylcytosine-specific restriction endonuclease McrA
MSVRIPSRLARDVRERAGEVCEYCRLPQASQEATFHIDHVTPRTNDGATTLENLALACVSCSLRKAAREKARDPKTGKVVPLFNPRIHPWREHFAVSKKLRIEGRTPIGRATITALAMNREAVVAIRQELAALGRFSFEF